MKTALVTGFSGQDGTFITHYLLLLGYKVVGLTRRVSTEPPHRVRGKFDFSKDMVSGQLVLESGDLTSVSSLIRIFKKHEIDEVYNLAAQSDVRVSFDQPELTFESNAMGVLNLLTAMAACAPKAKLYQASTSELFGTTGGIQNEETTFRPASPYAVAKLAAFWLVANYRKEGHFACNGILFNHESEIRGGGFVTQKIIKAFTRLKKTGSSTLYLGNLEARRDWGYAGDYVKVMHKMLQHDKPDDYVVATGESHTVREFVEMVAKTLGMELKWKGEGLEEVGLVDGKEFIFINPEFFRPVEVDYLHGDPSKAERVLGWKPETSFQGLIEIMVSSEMEE